MKAKAVLNWYAKDPAMLSGLREFFIPPASLRHFATIRLGTKWAQGLDHHDIVAVSISDDPKKPNVIGFAEIKLVLEVKIKDLKLSDLERNIGAKTHVDVVRDMRKVYGKKKVDGNSVVTLLWLLPIQ